jgi:hypothetical protein
MSPPVAVASHKMEASQPCQTQKIQSHQVYSTSGGASCQTCQVIGLILVFLANERE